MAFLGKTKKGFALENCSWIFEIWEFVTGLIVGSGATLIVKIFVFSDKNHNTKVAQKNIEAHGDVVGRDKK